MFRSWDVRWYELGDLPDLVKLHQEAFPFERWIAQRFCDFVTVCGNGCIVASHNGNVVASVLYRSTGKHTRIEYLSVVPEYRRRGIGRQLLKTLSKGQRSCLFTAFVREDAIEAQLFFKHCKFVAVPPFVCPDYFDDGVGAITFQRRIKRRGRTRKKLVAA